jgi:tRNA threonylcarbamoyladenosine biosynthesis protein TsaB
MKILALENSTTHGSIALFEDGQQAAAFQFANDRKHSGLFFQSLQKLGDRLQHLDAIAVGLGPGSYAGVRIAIASAIGLAAAHKAKLVGLPSICAVENAPNEYGVIGDARRNSYFFARVVENEIVEGIDLHGEEDLRARLQSIHRETPVFSCEPLFSFPQTVICSPSATLLGKLIEHGTVHSLKNPLQPIYLREPHITIPNDKRKPSLLG